MFFLLLLHLVGWVGEASRVGVLETEPRGAATGTGAPGPVRQGRRGADTRPAPGDTSSYPTP